MSRPVVINWEAPDVDAICELQTTAGAGNLIINGALAVTQGFPGKVILTDIYRKVSLTSTGNLSGINFTIVGTGLNGASITETIAGPNNNTVETTNLFKVINTVSVDAAVGTNVSIGTGTAGQTEFIFYNYHATVIGTAIQVAVTGTIDYTFKTSLSESPNSSNTFSPIVAMTGATTDQLAFYAVPTRYSFIAINSSTDGTLEAIFIQQGIT